MSSINPNHNLNQEVTHKNDIANQENLLLENNHYPYESPVFTDSQRLEKIKAALPALDKLFEDELVPNHYPALAYGLIVDGDLIHTKNFGYIDLEQKIPTTTQSLFRIASMTKSFVAMAIVKLRDDGKLRLDDCIYQYVPEFKKTNLLTTDAPLLTIRHLLTQDAGMPEDDPWADRQLALPDADFSALLNKGFSLSNPPGTIWEYNNISFSLLGRIITVVTQIPYQEYIKQEILLPLGMNNTYWEYSEAPSNLLARGYRWECGRYAEEIPLHDGSFSGMAGLISSVEDFSKYVAYHLQAWPPRNDPEYGPLRRSSLREMQHPWNFIGLNTFTHRSGVFTNSYCYGLFWSKNTDNVISIDHSGGLPGFGCNWIMLPDHGIGLVAFANRTYADIARINPIAMEQILSQATVQPRELPVPKILDERKQQLIEVLKNSWNINIQELSKIFSENFFLDYSLELRKTSSTQLFNHVGEILNIGEVIPKNRLRGRFDIKCQHGTIQVTFCLSPENPPLIQELYLVKTNI